MFYALFCKLVHYLSCFFFSFSRFIHVGVSSLVYLFEPLYCIQLNLYNNQFIKLFVVSNFFIVADKAAKTLLKL